MTDDPFHSTDSVRSGRALLHAQYVTFDEPLDLQHGGRIEQPRVAYETYGTLNEDRSNAILICHALTGDSHVAGHDEDDDPGWWEVMVGPGKPIDTDRYFVVCPNVLGGCRGTTGPNTTNPATGKPYGADFPLITVEDVVALQRRLIDHLRIDRLLTVVGGSLGGHMAMCWATTLPDRMVGVAVIATSARLSSQALAFDVVGRNAILRDPNYGDGQYYDRDARPLSGLAIARMLGHITYLSHTAMDEKFDADRLRPREVQTEFETRFSVGSYLAYQADKFGERFDANSYLSLTLAIDLFNLGSTPELLSENLARSKCRFLMVSFSSDWLFPPFQMREMVDALIALDRPVSYCNVQSACGHDAFLLPDEMDRYGEAVRAFLINLSEPAETPTPTADCPGCDACESDATHPTSIFHGHSRLDYDTIVDLIPAEAKVLDLGCGTGLLLDQLRRRGNRRVMGIERDELAIVGCLRRGLDVVHADLNKGLDSFAEGQFDVVVLSRTLQAIVDVERVLREMLRVGRRAIVSFPNLGYHKYRTQLAEEGRAPRLDADHGFDWHDTPSVRFLSIADFETFCRERKIPVRQTVCLDTEAGRRIEDDPNRNSDLAIVVLGD